jgi:uncharacterized protein YtpQ (UPF0354 family)
MKRLLALFLCTAVLTSFGQNPALGEREFAGAFAAGLQKAQPAAKISIVGPLELAVTDAQGKTHSAFLSNFFALYVAAPGRLDELIATFVGGYVDARAETDALEPSSIMPVIKDNAWISGAMDLMRARVGKDFREPVHDKLNDRLVVFYVEDRPRTVQFLTEQRLTASGLKRADLRALALNNLQALIPQVRLQEGRGVYMVTAGGTYESSLVLLDEIWKTRRIDVDGDYVVAIPARDMLFVTGSKNHEAVTRLRAIAARDYRDSAYRLSEDLFIYRNGVFSRFE